MSWWWGGVLVLGVTAGAGAAAIVAEMAYWRGYSHGRIAAWYGDPLEHDGWPRCGCCEREATTLDRGVPLCDRHRAVDPLRD